VTDGLTKQRQVLWCVAQVLMTCNHSSSSQQGACAATCKKVVPKARVCVEWCDKAAGGQVM
jgi:hypothetical protein